MLEHLAYGLVAGDERSTVHLHDRRHVAQHLVHLLRMRQRMRIERQVLDASACITGVLLRAAHGVARTVCFSAGTIGGALRQSPMPSSVFAAGNLSSWISAQCE